MANNLSAFDATKFSKKLVDRLNQTNVMLQFANREYEGDLTENSTVKIRTVGDVTMAPYNGAINYQDLAPATEDFTIADKSYFAFKVDDVDERQTDQDTNDLYAQRAVVTVANTVEAKIMSQYTKAAAANQITGASNAAIALDKTNIYGYFVEAAKRLNTQNAPSTGRWAAVDPGVAALLATAPELIRPTALGDDVIKGMASPGNFIGMIGGFMVFWSNAAPTTSSGGNVTARFQLFGAGKPIFYAGQIDKVERIRLQDSFATAVRGLLLHDATVVNEMKKQLVTLKTAP